MRYITFLSVKSKKTLKDYIQKPEQQIKFALIILNPPQNSSTSLPYAPRFIALHLQYATQ